MAGCTYIVTAGWCCAKVANIDVFLVCLIILLLLKKYPVYKNEQGRWEVCISFLGSFINTHYSDVQVFFPFTHDDRHNW